MYSPGGLGKTGSWGWRKLRSGRMTGTLEFRRRVLYLCLGPTLRFCLPSCMLSVAQLTHCANLQVVTALMNLEADERKTCALVAGSRYSLVCKTHRARIPHRDACALYSNALLRVHSLRVSAASSLLSLSKRMGQPSSALPDCLALCGNQNRRSGACRTGDPFSSPASSFQAICGNGPSLYTWGWNQKARAPLSLPQRGVAAPRCLSGTVCRPGLSAVSLGRQTSRAETCAWTFFPFPPPFSPVGDARLRASSAQTLPPPHLTLLCRRRPSLGGASARLPPTFRTSSRPFPCPV